MTYKIGTRVKKVRSRFTPALNVGNTGVVLSYLRSPSNYGSDCIIRMDQPGRSVHDERERPAGTEFIALSSEWEPILPEGSAPSEFSYRELMDNLKETVNV